MGIKRYLKGVARALLNKSGKTEYSAEKEYVIKQIGEKALDGKIAFVTGGSGTLGRAICMKLAAEGAKVFVGGRNQQKTNKVVDDVIKISGRAESVLIDVTDEKSVKEAISSIYDMDHRIDILVNCAGGSAREKMAFLTEQSMEVVDQTMAANIRGTILCSKYVGNIMKDQKSGKILNISSTTGIQGNSSNCDYTAAKSAIIGFTKALAQEMGQFGINVNCLSPGYIQTGIFSEERVEYLERTNFLRKVGTPENIADGALFLVSDRADFITGINLVIDGGRILGLHTFNQ